MRWPLASILLAAVALRVIALWGAGDVGLVLDEQLYLSRAEALLDGEGFVGSYQSWVRHPDQRSMARLPQYPGAYQPPMHTVFVASVLAVSGRSVQAVRLAQTVLGMLMVWGVYALGRAWFDERQGLIAAGIAALYPNLIAFTHYLWSETLFIVLLVWAVWFLSRTGGVPRTRDVVSAGLLLGMASLTRGIGFYLLPLIALWLLWVHRDLGATIRKRVVVLVLVAVAVVMPWTIRNTVLHGGVILIDTNGAFNLWRGNSPGTFAARPAPPDLSYSPPFQRLPLMPVGTQDQRLFVETVKRNLDKPTPSDLEIARRGRKLALGNIASSPSLFMRRAWTKIVDTWNPTSFLLRHFRVGAYDPVSPVAEGLLSSAAVVSYLVVMFFGAVGVFAGFRDPRVRLVMLMIAFITAIHAVTFGLTRFRLPMMPFIIVIAAHGLWLTVRWLAARRKL